MQDRVIQTPVLQTPAPQTPATQSHAAAPALSSVSETVLKSLVADMNRDGFAMLPDYLHQDDLAHLQHYVTATVDQAGGEYVGLDGAEKMRGTMLTAIAETPAFLHLMHRVYELGTGKKAPLQALYQVLRCISGKSGAVHSYMFHYDSYMVTALVPILIPQTGNAGHLVMVPNTRRLRSFYIVNLLDKMLLDNRLTQKLLKWGLKSKKFGLKQVAMVPGNLYLFWGYRTVHANEPCDPDAIRSTALFHFADPHRDSALRSLTGKAKARA